MRILFTTLIFFATCYMIIGQQKPQFTQYMLNKYESNPAYGGLERSLSVFTTYRDQYSSFTGNPKTFYIGADMPFYLWNGALGFTFYNQKSGLINNSNFKASYNYVMGTPFGFLSFGGRLGIDMINIDGGGIITPGGTYVGTVNHNDPILSTTNMGGVGFSWELGTYFKGANIEAGITIAELPSHTSPVGDANYTRSFVSSVFCQYTYTFNDEIDILPSIFVKADAAAVQTDVAIMGKYNENLFGGLSFRGYNSTSIDALAFIIGTNVGQKYKVSYSYDFGLSALNTSNQGSHEIMLSYNLQKLIGIGLPPKIIYNPRDL